MARYLPTVYCPLFRLHLEIGLILFLVLLLFSSHIHRIFCFWIFMGSNQLPPERWAVVCRNDLPPAQETALIDGNRWSSHWETPYQQGIGSRLPLFLEKGAVETHCHETRRHPLIGRHLQKGKADGMNCTHCPRAGLLRKGPRSILGPSCQDKGPLFAQLGGQLDPQK